MRDQIMAGGGKPTGSAYWGYTNPNDEDYFIGATDWSELDLGKPDSGSGSMGSFRFGRYNIIVLPDIRIPEWEYATQIMKSLGALSVLEDKGKRVWFFEMLRLALRVIL